MNYYSLGNCSMRPVGLDDLDLLAEHRNEMPTWKNLTHVLPVWEHRQKDWLNSLGERQLYFIGSLVGSATPQAFLRITDIDFINSNACIGLDIFRSFRSKGFGGLYFEMLVKYCFDVLNLHRVWLLVMEDNVPAQTIYEKNGFEYEGVLKDHLFREGKYRNYLLMGKINDTAI